MNKKIINRRELKDVLKEIQAGGKRIVFTNGCFDILHVGHIHYLQKAKECGDLLVVGLNSDSSVRRLKGEARPLYPQDERAEILAALEMIDFVTIFDEDDPRTLITELQPDVLVKGGDYQIEEILGRETVREKGGEVKTIPMVPGRSTSKLIEIIKERFAE